MKPSDINLERRLVGTFKKAEREHAALLLIGLMQERDEWRDVTIGELIEYTRDRADRRLVGNPFFRPDLNGLHHDGILRWIPDDGILAFTELGLERLRSSVHCQIVVQCVWLDDAPSSVTPDKSSGSC